MSLSHLDKYLKTITRLNKAGKQSLQKASLSFVNDHVANFTHMARTKGLLFGQVQSGKTAHMFGIIAATADEDPGFKTFVLLTSNNRALHKQTIDRAFRELPSFNVCNETDDARFIHAGRDRPTVVILKKDPNVLRSWNSHFGSSARLKSGPIFILDDEADNASQNTKVNQKELSTIFDLIQAMRGLGTSSIYLQVTATPQALLLQNYDSETRPEFLHYFEPEPGYLGGDFFFSTPAPYVQVQIRDGERADLLDIRAGATPGLQRAIATFIVTCAEISRRGQSNVNFLVHPSAGTGDHAVVAKKIQTFVKELRDLASAPEIDMLLFAAHQDLLRSCPELLSFTDVLAFLESDAVFNVYLLNSSEDAERGNDFENGFNIVVGGNTLGRGVTFSKLQTVYYVRSAKTPQADTYWQHSRMFGYDRYPELIRVFMPPSLFRTFGVFYEANQKLIAQLRTGSLAAIQIVLEKGFSPTRKNVLNVSSYSVLIGGTNYFPSNPNEMNGNSLDRLLKDFDEFRDGHLINSSQAFDILGQTKNTENSGWPVIGFMGAIEAITAKSPGTKIRLLVRRNRDISKDTGTLLSPDDRKTGSEFPDDIVITVYRLTGTPAKGWNGLPFWIPNVRLPEGMVFHRGNN